MTQQYQPQATPETARYWEGVQQRELWLQRCTSCGKAYFYPRPFCPNCSSTAVEWFQASGKAKLYSYVINYRAVPGSGFEAPFIIALVELEEGPRMATNLVGIEPNPDLLKLDMPLKVTFQQRGEKLLLYFQPEEVAE